MSNPPDPYEELRKRNREGNVDPQLQIQQMQQQQLENAGKKLSPEEQKVMQSCQSESFWYRSMPMSVFLSGLAHYGVSNGYLSASARWGSRPKVLLGGIVGYFFGKFSYVNECADKFLIEAPDGHVADMIRVKRGLQPRASTDTAAAADTEGYGAMAAPRQPSPVYTNPASPTYQGPAVAGEAGQQLSGYDELRRRNREAGAGFTPAYQRQLDPSHSLSSSPNLQSLPPDRDPFKPAADGGPYQALSPPVPPVADSAPPSKLRPLPRTGSNKYEEPGDSVLNMDSSMSDGERSSELDRSSDHLEAAAEDSEGGPERKKMKLDPDQSKGSESDDPLAKLLESPGSDKTSESKPAPPKLPKLNISSASGSSGGEAEEERTPGLLDTPTTPHPDGLAAMERLKAEQAQEDREKMQLLVSRFTEDQLDRYAMYRRSALPKTTVKKIMQTITGSSVGQNVVIAMAGIAKVFAGEVIEEALASMESVGEAGQPVRPKHLREAVRKMRSKGTFMPKLKKKCPFN